MKNQMITWAVFLLFTVSLMGQSPAPVLLEKYQNRGTDRLEHPLIFPKTLSELDQSWSYQLDSIVRGYYDTISGQFTEIEEKEVFTYNENGFKQSATTFYYGEEGYSPSSRLFYEYDNEGRVLKFGIQIWSSGSLKWSDLFQEIFFYNEEGQLEESHFYEENYFSNEFELSAKYFYTFNSLGQMLSLLEESFESGEIVSQSEWKYTYDENDHETSFSFWLIEEGMLPMELSRTEYEYDSIGRLVLEIEYETFDYGVDLTPFKKDSFIYDEQNKLVLQISYGYDEEAWTAVLKMEYEYDKSDVPSLITTYLTEGPDNWAPYIKEEILSDEKGNILSYNSSRPSIFDENSWAPDRRIELDRSDEIRLDDLSPGSLDWTTDEYYYDFDFRGFQEGSSAVLRYSFRVWNPFSNQWDYENSRGESVFYYSEVTTTTSVEEIPTFDNFLVYPNPVDRLLTIETDLTDAPFDLYLYNLFGQRIFRKNISANEQILLPDLPEGMYVLQLMKGKEMLGSRKVMIRH
jgi:hypothetical protein